VGDDLRRAQPEGRQGEVTCHLQTTGGGAIEATLNGNTLGDPTVAGDWLDFPIPPEWLKQGVNRFGLRSQPEPRRTGAEPEWTVQYTGDKMPSSPWTKMGFRGSCLAEVRDGNLFIADRGTEGGDYAFFRYPCFIDPSDETIIEVRLKVVSGWSSVLIENGVSSVEIQFYPDRVEARNCRLSHAIDTTATFHTYRISIEEDDFQVSVDGQPAIDGTGRLTHPAYNGRSGIAFGAANSPSLGEACWESVKIHNRARSLNDLVLSIRFKEVDE